MKFRAEYLSPHGGCGSHRATPAVVNGAPCVDRNRATCNSKKEKGSLKINLCRGGLLAAMILATALSLAAGDGRSIFVLTSTNDPSGNAVVVFKLNTEGTPSLSMIDMLPTGGLGGASGNAGILQFKHDRGAVANYGSNSVSQLARHDDFITVWDSINLRSGCLNPDSVALTEDHLFVVGTNCAESHGWPSGKVEGSVVSLTDNSAAQIAVGRTWAAVTLKSGSVLQLPLTDHGALTGVSNPVKLPPLANDTPLGAAFWKNILGFTPAHSPDNFAIVDPDRNVYPIAFPNPPGPYPNNAPCWVAKGPASVWYTGNSPGKAISEFFSDGQGGAFYKSIPLPGTPTDITVSEDGNWLAVIYTAGGEAYVSVYAVDSLGDLTPEATSTPIGVAAFNGVAISK